LVQDIYVVDLPPAPSLKGGGNPASLKVKGEEKALPSLEGREALPGRRDRGIGSEPRQLTHDRFSDSAPQWSPDGRRILFMALADPDSFNPGCRALKTVDLDGNVETVHSGWGGYETAAWLPDGRGIVFTGQEDGHPIGSKNDLWVCDLTGAGEGAGEGAGQRPSPSRPSPSRPAPTNLTRDFKYGVGGGLRSDMPVSLDTRPRLSADGKTTYVQVQQGGNLHIYAVALDDVSKGESPTRPYNIAPLVTGERAAMLLDASDTHLLFVESNHHNPGELCIADLDGCNEKCLTHVNSELMAGLELARVEHLLFPGVDGTQVEGWALLPLENKAHAETRRTRNNEYEEGIPETRPYRPEHPNPTVLYIHGGPHMAFGNIFNFDFLYLPARGYTCLLINHRASTGYGDEFSTAIKGDWGNLDYQDLMYGVDYAIAQGFTDPDKLGCTGISGGGNLSCWIVGHTDRFKAAMPENPVSDWLSFYGTSDIGVWFGVEELGGHPHEIPEIYRKCSPVTYAHNCKTPTLMVQGENDYRCPAGQSEEFYTMLKANGCVAEMLRLPNSSHGGAMSGALAMRRAHREALLEWMDRYVMGKTE
jgi:dipeptidyl aminopeptidase/acylaminoacyl peptidase